MRKGVKRYTERERTILVKKICNMIAQKQQSIVYCCKKHGVSDRTFYKWVKMSDDDPEKKTNYRDLLATARTAKAEKKMAMYEELVDDSIEKRLRGTKYIEVTKTVEIEYRRDSKGNLEKVPKGETIKRVEKTLLASDQLLLAIKRTADPNFAERKDVNLKVQQALPIPNIQLTVENEDFTEYEEIE